jgi:hypothetical protein
MTPVFTSHINRSDCGDAQRYPSRMKRIVADDEVCPSCGAALIYWLPDDISIADVPNKIKAATTLPPQNGIDTHAPMHPGRYCESGCVAQMFNFGNDDLWDRLESQRKERETASLIVRPSSHNDTPLRDFKIFVDRYIRATAPRDRDTAPKHCVYLELEPGDHVIVVRDYDHLSADRRESNTLQFTIEPHEQLTFLLALQDGQLQLQKDG